MKRQLFKLLCVFIISCFSFYYVVTLSFKAGLNYAGYCITENRMFSDDEIINLAAQKLNFREYVYNQKKQKHEVYIPYSSVKELREKNPDCCKILPPPGFIDRVLGYRGNLYIKIDARYTEENENLRSFEAIKVYEYGNCGEIY